MEEEIWKDIASYENLYQVSNLGRVKSLDRYVAHWRGGQLFRKGELLKPANSKNRYYTVHLCKLGIHKTFRVHNLVADTFLSKKNYPNIVVVNHINSDRFDNMLINLEYISPYENRVHAALQLNKFVGVTISSKHKKYIKYEAQIRYKGVYKWLGYFDTQESAYRARLDYMKANNIESKY